MWAEMGETGRSATTSELLQAHLPESHVVKAFNNIFAPHLGSLQRPHGDPERSALVIAGNDAGAKATVTDFLDSIGYDAHDAGPLAEGWRIQRDTPGYGPRLTADELRAALGRAERTRA